MSESPEQAAPDALSSAEELRRRLGRPIRVLHIGNIANNAYNNAVIQRQYGIEADVACDDYYHFAGCPEWEDGAAGIGLDPFLPNWWATHLNGFKRPLWFAQAPLIHCVAYLDAYRSGIKGRIADAALLLEAVYARLIVTAAAERGAPAVDPRPWKQRVPGLRRWQIARSISSDASRASVARIFVTSILHKVRRQFSMELWRTRTYNSVHSILAMSIWPMIVSAAGHDGASRSRLMAAYGALRRILGRRPQSEAMLLEQARAATAKRPPNAGIAMLPIIGRVLCLAMQAIAYGVVSAAGLLGTSRNAMADPARLSGFVADLEAEAPQGAQAAHFLAEARRTVDERTRYFARILGHYDIVQGYALDAVIPLAAGFPAVTAYEHGTIRDIPFENSVNRILCRAAYRQAHGVFVTNTDVFPSIGRMGLDSARVHNLPHAFDDSKLRRWRSQNPLTPPEGPVLCFAPTRQHWANGDRTSFAKGNDIYLRGLGELHRRGVDFRLIAVEWGRDVAASKALIDELGYASRVEWVTPLDKRRLWAAYCTSHVVIDQFTLPALGGVGFEVLALGRRLMTLIDAPRLAEFFGAAPPVLNAATVAEFVAAAERVVADPDDRQGIGAAGARWIEEYHSARRIVDIQARVYARLLDEAKNRA
jgi:glycosyltransferase involved in cell wall biosynthesis